MYTRHIELTQSKRKLLFYCLLHYIREHTLSIMAPTFEDGNYILTCSTSKGHLENMTDIKSSYSCWPFQAKTYAADRATKIELLMREHM